MCPPLCTAISLSTKVVNNEIKHAHEVHQGNRFRTLVGNTWTTNYSNGNPLRSRVSNRRSAICCTLQEICNHPSNVRTNERHVFASCCTTWIKERRVSFCLSVCMCVCMYICTMYVCIMYYVCMYVRTYVCMNVCICVCVCVCIFDSLWQNMSDWTVCRIWIKFGMLVI